MRIKKTQRVHHLTLIYPNNLTRTVKIQAASRKVAEKRALKHNRGAIGVKDGS